MFVKNSMEFFNKEDLFYCRDPVLKDFLCNKGISFIGKSNDEESEVIWLFIKTTKLSNTLILY